MKEVTNYLTKYLKTTNPVVMTQAAAPRKHQLHEKLRRLGVMTLVFVVMDVNLRNVVGKIHKKLKLNTMNKLWLL